MEPSQDSVKKTPRLKEMFDKFRKVFEGERSLEKLTMELSNSVAILENRINKMRSREIRS